MSQPPRTTLLRDETLLLDATPPGRGRAVLLFPNSYHTGMSSLAVHALYRELNLRGLVCERAFAPEAPSERGAARPRPGAHRKGDRRQAAHEGREDAAGRSLESGTPLAGFDFVLVTTSFELDWLRLPAALEAGGLPPLARDRDEQFPLLIVGGPAVTQNPAPLAEIVDVAVIGEFEPIADRFVEVLLQADTREEVLAGLGELPGVWLPHGEAPEQPVQRQCAASLDGFDTASAILTPHTEFGNRFLIEVSRGCGRGCRFCLARAIYRPLRARRPERIIEAVRDVLPHTDLVGLVGAAISDYPWADELVTALRELKVRLSVSSVRAESVSPVLLQALADSGQDTLTLAPEAGAEGLRGTIGKGMTDDDLRRAISLGLDSGMTRFKLYFMVGLPGETDADAQEIVALVLRLRGEYPEAMFSAALGPFVPKPHTAFESEAATPEAVSHARIRAVEEALRHAGVRDVTAGSARWAEAQTVLSRGGRELGPALVAASAAGGTLAALKGAVQATGHRWESYLEPWPADKPRPWAIVVP